ncbi:hypothetical protein C8R43DRAFT_1113853 [Mycena crocata]|nr:hypothetical protein C8R43DRAFT_1113853 [Mycena crocata]
MVNSYVRAGLVINFALIVTAAVIPRVPAGTQFVTGPCTADADCAEGCCAFTTGKCAGPVIALTRDGGCGFGTGTPNANAAIALGQFPGAVEAFSASIAAAGAAPTSNGAAAPAAPAAPAATPAKAPGTQFITGPCSADGDCASGCCNAATALCAARLVALEGAGCGFGSPSAGVGAAKPVAATPAAGGAAPAAPPAATTPAKAPGTQFITGPCSADGDCASGCCNAATALCAARLVALEGAGCGFGSPSAGVGAAKPVATPAAAGGAAPAPAAPAAPAPAANGSPAKAPGTQFITGTCTSDGDCASGCCGKKSGLCAARLVAQEGAGCGFGA